MKKIGNEFTQILFGVKVDHPRVWAMQRLIFLIILTLLLIKPTANAIFLATAGVSQLPIAYILVAFIALGFTLFYNRFIATLSPTRIFYRSTQVCFLIFILIGIILLSPGFRLIGAYIFYVFISIFGILSASQFWILANQMFNAREARKYFGLIGFGAIAGGISGGYLASFITSFTQSEFIPFIAAFFLLIVLFMIRRLPEQEAIKPKKAIAKDYKMGLKEPIALIKNSRHLFFLALIIATSVFTAKLIDYQFGFFASKAYPLEEDLTQFYGIMFSSFNAIALLLQIFLTTRLIGRLGIGYSLIILPVILLLNTSLLILIPGLILVSSLKLSEASMKQSLNKSAIELMMLPIPEDIKLKTKTFLDVFIDSIATGATGIVLIVLLQSSAIPSWGISLVTLISCAIWLFLANKLRIEYKSVFRTALKIQSDTSSQTNILKDYINIFRSGNDFQILKSLNLLKTNPIKGIEKEALVLLQHANIQIICATIDLIMYDKADYSEEIKNLLDHPNQNVKISAFEYILNHQNNFEPNYLLDKINDPDPEIRTIAIVAYVKEFQNDLRILNVLRISDRLHQILNISDVSPKKKEYLTVGVMKAIGYGKFEELYHVIDTNLKSQNLFLKGQAILAAGETKSTSYLIQLVDLLQDDRWSDQAILAICKYSNRQLSKLIQQLNNDNNVLALTKISKAFETKPTQQSVATLLNLVEHDHLGVRNSAITSLRILSDHYPLLNIDNTIINNLLITECRYNNLILNSLLANNHNDHTDPLKDSKLETILKQKIDQNLGLIFELLHIKYPPENYLELYGYIKDRDNDLRNNAIEYVDNSLTYDLKSAIIPLLEFITKSSDLENLDQPDLSEKDIKEFLLHNRDEDIRQSAKEYYAN